MAHEQALLLTRAAGGTDTLWLSFASERRTYYTTLYCRITKLVVNTALGRYLDRPWPTHIQGRNSSLAHELTSAGLRTNRR